MKIFWEGSNWAGSTIEPNITCLAWMPYGAKGLLAVGSESGVVGITHTDIAEENQCNKRYNFNLRGHHSAIGHVSWNKPQTKLVSCDVSGFIYVWVKNDERWSVELVNDRSVKVKDFCWSWNGNNTLICYEDNFVLIGSSSGTRVWSSNYDTVVNCGAWSPNSEEVVVGFSSGSIQVLNEHGNIIHEREIANSSIVKAAFSSIRECDQKWTLALCSFLDVIVFTNTYYEVEPFTYQSIDPILELKWSSCGCYLAVICASNRITILSYRGDILHTFTAPLSKTPLTAFTWAHDDNAVIIAAGGQIATGRIIVDVPLLSQLVTYQLWVNVGRNASKVDQLSLPNREKNCLKQLDHHVINCRVPSLSEIPKAICKPTEWRWYCTIVPIPKKAHQYMLCVEHMGGLVPILLGRQINRIIPQFLISLPPHLFRRENGMRSKYENGLSSQVRCSEDLTTFHRNESNQRASLWRQSKRQFRRFMNKRVTTRSSRTPPVLVSVTSNVWCTKFKISAPGIDHLPNFLANVVYKTSLLHLQPRQMMINLCDLRDSDVESRSLSEIPITVPPSSRRLNSTSIEMESIPTNNSLRQTGSNIEEDVAELQRLLNDNTDIFENNNDERNQTPMEFDDDHDTALLAEEKVFYSTVLTEFDGLRQALHSHIDRMKQFASEIELASSHLVGSKQQQQPTIISKSLQAITKPSISQGSRPTIPQISRPSTSTGVPRTDETVWRNRLENIEYIDDDDELIISDESHRLLSTNSKSSAQRLKDDIFSKKKQKQLSDIRAVVEKLSLMANELSTRMPPSSTGRNPSVNLRVGNNAVGTKSPPTLKQELPSEMTVAELRAEVRNIAQQVSKIEEKITIDMLNDIRGDLQQRVQHIKAVLGVEACDACSDSQNAPLKKAKQTQKTLTMSNKTPFWNETTQVYQLDFGGRVTQESAKNFQIEYNSEQVMQFGRIENGYTLDFKSPFSAVQAFSIALASITQRLK